MTLSFEIDFPPEARAARDLFFEVWPIVPRGDEVSYRKLTEAARLWREKNQHFGAGIAMLRAADAAWGNPDRMIDSNSHFDDLSWRL
jgi:hypothetical protein